MKFIIFNGTLKPDNESNTSKVVMMLKLAFEKLGQECKVVTLRDLEYERATKDVKDELAPHIIDIFNSATGNRGTCLTNGKPTLKFTSLQTHMARRCGSG